MGVLFALQGCAVLLAAALLQWKQATLTCHSLCTRPASQQACLLPAGLTAPLTHLASAAGTRAGLAAAPAAQGCRRHGAVMHAGDQLSQRTPCTTACGRMRGLHLAGTRQVVSPKYAGLMGYRRSSMVFSPASSFLQKRACGWVTEEGQGRRRHEGRQCALTCLELQAQLGCCHGSGWWGSGVCNAQASVQSRATPGGFANPAFEKTAAALQSFGHTHPHQNRSGNLLLPQFPAPKKNGSPGPLLCPGCQVRPVGP